MKSLSVFLFIAISCIAAAQAAKFDITNRCNHTVWAAAMPGGGMRLNSGETWSFNMTNGTTGARIWGRTNCSFDRAGRGKCETGDCEGVLECKSYGTAPNTLVEFALNQYNNLDFYDISLVDGFNIPVIISPNSTLCKAVNCTGNINGECPRQLKATGGCHNPCTVYNTTQYCCSSGSCGPTTYSRYFKDRCPEAYSYPKDDATSTFSCPGGTNYGVVFCP
ncbi:protein P21-like [Gastrolobium bilobum]|uniref:protein P21-like n=1 Tax=Gastrolobium bilobum TaxID=150636 RepID=UPI002AB13F7B|nr:protein P21-like [Gastrolobium bilobum]